MKTAAHRRFPLRLPREGWLATAYAVLACVLAFEVKAATTVEYQVKAAYLVNFAKLVEWPPTSFASANSPFVVGVLGGGETLAAIQPLVEGKKVGHHPIQVRAVTLDSISSPVHVLLIGRHNESSLAELQAALRGAATLLVGETENFAERIGMVGFTLEEDSVRLTLNLERAMAAGLKVSSKLSNVARLVKTKRDS